MQILNTLTDKELHETVIKEVAKARNEIRCAEADMRKANGRLSFLIVLANELIQRTDKQEKRYEDYTTGGKATTN
tara:strand:+ start:944 stop:1168 length:225 start_codon:yes stop_codon:yes gene_type:complete